MLILKFGVFVFRIGLRYWFVTIPIILIWYWKPKNAKNKSNEKYKRENFDLDPNKEIKPSKPPIVEDENKDE
jgi:hypothetical protein